MSNTTLTEHFLRTLSSHLSGRKDCWRRPYKCVIGMDDVGSRQLDIMDILGRDFESYISFDPEIQIYPSVHRRKDANKVTVLNHVLHDHFPELLAEDDALGNNRIKPGMLVEGVYEYQVSVTGRSRRWTRIA